MRPYSMPLWIILTKWPARSGRMEVLPAEQRYALNLPDIAEVWRRGSVIAPGFST